MLSTLWQLLLRKNGWPHSPKKPSTTEPKTLFTFRDVQIYQLYTFNTKFRQHYFIKPAKNSNKLGFWNVIMYFERILKWKLSNDNRRKYKNHLAGIWLCILGRVLAQSKLKIVWAHCDTASWEKGGRANKVIHETQAVEILIFTWYQGFWSLVPWFFGIRFGRKNCGIEWPQRIYMFGMAQTETYLS